jgi:zinc transporter ZupT
VEIICSLIAAIMSTVGSIILVMFYSWANKHSTIIMNIVAGMMLTIACLHLIPEGISLNYNGMIYSLLGFIFMLCLELFLHNDNNLNKKHSSTLFITSLALHSVIDGIILSITFKSEANIGFITTCIILIHKLFDGLTIAGTLLNRTNSKRNIFYLSVLISLLTPLSTTISTLYFCSISMKFLGALFCITAGTFIFLSSTEFIPEMLHKNNKLLSFICFIFGFLIAVIAK